MKSVALNAFPRTLGRRAGAKRLRANGRIPAVIYGRQAQPQSLEVIAKEMENLIHHSASENLLVDLEVKEDARAKRLALVHGQAHAGREARDHTPQGQDDVSQELPGGDSEHQRVADLTSGAGYGDVNWFSGGHRSPCYRLPKGGWRGAGLE